MVIRVATPVVVCFTRRRHLSVYRQRCCAGQATGPVNVEYLVKEFGGHGVSFESIGESCVVKMRHENGSSANLLLPGGVVTSYKPAMWHGTTVEVLHTTVSEGEDGGAVIRGGVSMDFELCAPVDNGVSSWSPAKWSLSDVIGRADKSIKVALVCDAPEYGGVEVRCVVTLRSNVLSSEIFVKNHKRLPLQLTGSVINHLTVSTPDATYMVGLQGSSYIGRPPMSSEFCIIPPDFSRSIASTKESPREMRAFWGLFSSRGIRDGVEQQDPSTEESDGEECEDYAHLTNKMCRTYANAPREFSLVDRGRRNSIMVGRSRFDSLYILSPGSNHDWYGKYAFICVGPTVQNPVILGPGGVWEGGQYLHNPNI